MGKARAQGYELEVGRELVKRVYRGPLNWLDDVSSEYMLSVRTERKIIVLVRARAVIHHGVGEHSRYGAIARKALRHPGTNCWNSMSTVPSTVPESFRPEMTC